MSCKVLVVPEDPTYNGYLLQPLVRRILSEAGRPHAQIQVLRDPKTGSFEQAYQLLASGILRPRYGHFDLWLFLPDGDKNKDLKRLEEMATGQKAKLLATYLTPEVEITIIAGHARADTTGWKEKRAHAQFKEHVFAPFLAEHGNPRAPGQGREKLMLEALQNYARIKRLVPEVATLEERVAKALN